MKTELEKCMAGETFSADESTLSLSLRAKRLVRQLNACDYADGESKAATHSTDPSVRNHSDNHNAAFWCNTYSRPIRIEDEVWIGGGAIILPGVTIGHGAVIGAGAVVTRDIPALSVTVGCPARVIKKIETKER